MNFTKTFFASLLAFVVGNVLFVVFSLMFMFMLIAMIGSFTTTITPKLKSNSVLMLDLKDGISDSPSALPFVADLSGGVSIKNTNTILQAVQAIENAASDRNIKGAYINLSYSGNISDANIEELRAALQNFRTSGKFVISYSDSYSQMDYYLSSVADRVYLNPLGDFDWRGMAEAVMFYKGLLDKLDIHAEIIRHGSFKAAVEPFMLDQMSPENREQTSVLLGSRWDAILTDISQSRGIDKQVLSAYASDLTINSPQMAYDCGMIDGILYEDQVIDMLGRLAAGLETIGSAEVLSDVDAVQDGNCIEIGAQSDTLQVNEMEEVIRSAENEVCLEKDAMAEIASDSTVSEGADFEVAGSRSPVPNLISLADYIKGSSGHASSSSKHKVAIVYVDGDITYGEGRPGSVGGKGIAEKLKSAREDKNVKAVVLRVNSPGGVLIGSEIIWREMELTRQQKPVVVSMGDLAASGGYYISCPADVILADRLTITGSIGVFGLLFDVGEALSKNLGVTVDVVQTNPSADMGAGVGFRRISGFERRFLQQQVEDAYSAFVTRVADGRNMTVEAVDSIGGGRVWSGVSAYHNGLVDNFGGIMDAVRLAAQRGGVESNYHIWEVVDSPDYLSAIFSTLAGTQEMRLNSALGESLRHYNAVMNMIDNNKGIQARMLYDIEML